MEMKALLNKLVLLILVFALAACSGGGDTTEKTSADKGEEEQEKVEIRFAWWGDTKRHEIYNAIADNFEKEYPNITVKREFGGWGDYWDKLSTQIAGGNAPDVFGMHQFYVADYARRNALLKLDDFVDAGIIDQNNFPEPIVDSGRVGADLFMVAQGVTMTGYVYNTAVFDELGVEYPDMNWTWEDFNKKVIEVQEAIESDDMFAVGDGGGGQLQPLFRYFLRQKGKDSYTDDGQLAFDKEDLIEWWTMWDDLRQQGVIPDAETGAEYQNVPLEQNMFVTGRTAITTIPVNQMHLYQQQFDTGEIQAVRIPTSAGGENGEFIEGAYLSIPAKSDHPEEAATFINYFVNAEEALKIFKVEQGSPGSTEMVEVVKPLLDPAQQNALDFIQETVAVAERAPYAPVGGSEIDTLFGDCASAISFGEMTVEEAADKFWEEANAILQ
jgi:multiple sugar transport system substrate-binding protein